MIPRNNRPLVRCSPAKATRLITGRLQLFVVCSCLLSLLPGATEAAMCGVPGRSENGTIVSLYSAAVYNPGQKSEYSCRPGLALLGDSIRSCQNDGLWSGSRPRCVANLAYQKPVASSRVVNHYRPDLLVDGNVQSCIYLDTRVDDRFIQIDLGRNHLISGLVLHVPDGYEQELTVFIAEKLESAPGIQYRRCTQGPSRVNAPKLQIECRGEDGGAVSVPGRFLHIRDERKIHDFYFALCEIEIYGLPDAALSCGVPDTPAFASAVNETQLLDEREERNTFELTCQTGFVLRGPKVLRCIDGNWVGSETARCVAVECHSLVPLVNGQIDLFPVRGLSNNSFNSVARHRCSEGFMIFGGDVTRTCGQDGRWTGTPPFCRPTDCQLPRPISNAVYKLVDSHTRPGSIAQYTCFNGYVPQRILADKPLQTAIVCQRSGLWKEGNFYCALRTTYYSPVSASFSTTTDKSSSDSTEVSLTSVTTSSGVQETSASMQEIEFVQSVTTNDLEGELAGSTSASVPISVSSSSSDETSGDDKTQSTGTAVAATGFVAAFILILMVIVGVALNLCRMRAAFDRVKRRLLLASTNLLLSSDPATKEGVCNIGDNSSRRHVTVVKVETEPVYNDLDDALVLPSPSPPSSEEESTYLDIDMGKNGDNDEDEAFKYCTEKAVLPYQSESSFIEARPSLSPDEILMLYARIDKTKKTKNRTQSIGGDQDGVEATGGQEERDKGFDTFDDAPKPSHRLDQSFSCKIRDFHPKKVNDLQLANKKKTVVDVSLNEFFIEHSRIRCKEKNVTYVLEGRPLPALPRAQDESQCGPDRDEESDSQHIYATLPISK